MEDGMQEIRFFADTPTPTLSFVPDEQAERSPSPCDRKGDGDVKYEVLDPKALQRRFNTDKILRRLNNRQHWTSEITALISGVITVAVLVSVLRSYDGKEIWNRPITLNAVLSLLVTIFYMLVMFPVSSCILQLRWNHFSSPSPLYDFHLYDAATRSLLSALRIMTSRAQSLLMFLAGFLVLAHAAIGPLTQQILLTTTIELPVSGDALVPIIREMNMSQVNAANPFQSSYAVLAGISMGQAVNFNTTPLCTTEACEWPDYASIMIRTKISTLSDGLTYVEDEKVSDAFKQVNWTAINESEGTTVGALPASLANIQMVSSANGTGLMWLSNFTDVLSQINPDSKTGTGIGYNNFSLLLASTRYSNTTPGDCPDQTTITLAYQEATGFSDNSSSDRFSWSSLKFGRGGAWQATFDIVAQPLRATLANGSFTEFRTADASCFANNQTSDRRTSLMLQGQEFVLDSYSSGSLYQTLQQFFQGEAYFHTGQGYDQPQVLNTQGDNICSMDNSNPILPAMFEFASAQVDSNGNSSSSSSNGGTLFTVEDSFNSIANSLSLVMRNTAGQTAAGTSLAGVTVYRIDWPWVSIPAALLTLTALLLVFVAHDTKRKGLPVWTDNSMASLVHGIDESSRRELAAIQQTDELDEACKKLRVQLSGPNLVLESSETGARRRKLFGSSFSSGV